MGIIGSSFEKLDGWLGEFGMEVFASILKKDWIEEALEVTGRHSKRERKLPAQFTLWLVVAMGFYRNLSIKNLLDRMGNIFGVGSLWEGGEDPASSSAVEARDRLGFGPLRRLVKRFRSWVLEEYRDAMSWKGHLLVALDGTTLKVPDSDENRKRFGVPRGGRGRGAFPQMRALFLVSTRLRFILQGLFSPYRRAEIHLALRMLEDIPGRSVVLLDANFNAWQFLLGIRGVGNHFLIRAKDNMKGKVLLVLGRGDRLVEMKIHRQLRRRFPDLPKTVILREISAQVNKEKVRYFTSLLEPGTYEAAELVRLYHERWEEEILIDEIKTHQCGATTVNRPVIFRCKTSRRVLQEAYGLVLAYNLVRTLMAEGAQRAGVPAIRISFVDSLERIRTAALLMAAAPTRSLPRIFDDLIRSIGYCVLPRRRERFNPREVCIKMSGYRKKRKPA